MNDKDFHEDLAFKFGEAMISLMIDMLITTEGFDEPRALAFARRYTLEWAVACEQAKKNHETQEAE